MNTLFQAGDIKISKMDYRDVSSICELTNDESDATVAYYNNQLKNQGKQECIALLALYKGEIAGYVFLYYKCKWGGLGNCNIPGVVDLFVCEKYRKKGIATVLMDVVEEEARKHSTKVYLDVCLNSEYGPAQRLYIKRGYIPDGKGVYYEERVCETNADCKNDDELTLCLVKERI